MLNDTKEIRTVSKRETRKSIVDIQQDEQAQYERYVELLSALSKGMSDEEYKEIRGLMIVLNKDSERVEKDLLLLTSLDKYKARNERYPKHTQELQKVRDSIEDINIKTHNEMYNLHPLDGNARRAVIAKYADKLKVLKAKESELDTEHQKLNDTTVDHTELWKHLRIKAD